MAEASSADRGDRPTTGARPRRFLSAAARLPRPRPAFVFLAILCWHGGYVLLRGVGIAPDSRTYGRWARVLVDSGFDFAGTYEQAAASFPPILYSLFVTSVALLRLPFGEGWPVALVLLNVAASATLAVLLVRLAGRTTGSALAAWAALALYMGCFAFAQWARVAMSDTSFCLIAFTIFSLAATRILGEARRWGGVMALAAAGVFYRPTGMVLLPDLGWAAWLAGRRGRSVPRGAALALLAAAVLAGAAAFAWFMEDPERWPFQALADAFRIVAAGYAEGEVVSARFETYHAPPQGLIDHMAISTDRFLHFFAPVAAGFSPGHMAVQLAFFVPCYALAAWLLAALWRGDTAFGAAERRVFLAAVGAVLAYALFHGLVQVDFDWRYRLPVLPHLILLAAGGLADLERRARRKAGLSAS